MSAAEDVEAWVAAGLSAPVLALLGIVSELCGRYSPERLAASVGSERVLNGVKHVHRFTRAVSVGNPREFLQAEKQEQEMAEACKRRDLELHHLLELSLFISEARGDG